MTMPGNRPKLLHLAAAMMLSLNIEQQQAGHQLMNKLHNHFRTIGGNEPSRAAHYKRQAKKRNNLRARSGKK